jgi:glycosyltransferase involved in cell wall biosynthesis
MHILLIHQPFASADQPGGTRHFEILSEAVRHGHQATVVASDVGYITGQLMFERRRLIQEEKSNGIRIMRAYVYAPVHRSFFHRFLSFISFVFTSFIAAWKAGKVDLVVGTSPPLLQPLSAWAIAVLRRRPFLLEIRDLWPEFPIEMGVLKNRWLIKLARGLEMFLYRRATHLLVNSPAYRKYLIDKGVPAQKISFIANGTDVKQFDPQADGKQFREEIGLNGQFVVTYAGTIGVSYDLATAIDAAHLTQDDPEIHWLFVGDGKERAGLEERARSLGLKNVTFTGPQPKRRMGDILAASDACLAILQNIPMFRTTYPNKVFDYMAAGRPTVLVIDGVIRDVIETARGGLFVEPGDAARLADTIRWLRKNRDEATAMGNAAREHVVQHFNREKQAQEFVGLAEMLMRRRQSADRLWSAAPEKAADDRVATHESFIPV